MNIRRRTGVMGAGRVHGGPMKNAGTPPIGAHFTPNVAAHITNSVGLKPEGGKSEFKKIKGTVNP